MRKKISRARLRSISGNVLIRYKDIVRFFEISIYQNQRKREERREG